MKRFKFTHMAIFKDQVIKILLWIIGAIVTASGAGVGHLIVTQEKYQDEVRGVKADHKVMQLQMYYIAKQDSLQDIKISDHERRLIMIESYIPEKRLQQFNNR